jgi:hypothetical protein
MKIRTKNKILRMGFGKTLISLKKYIFYLSEPKSFLRSNVRILVKGLDDQVPGLVDILWIVGEVILEIEIWKSGQNIDGVGMAGIEDAGCQGFPGLSSHLL